MGWVVQAAELVITRDGESVKLKRGDPVPEAEFWEARDKLQRTRHIRKMPDPPVETPKKKEPKSKDEAPKRKRGRPKKVVEVSTTIEKPDPESLEE